MRLGSRIHLGGRAFQLGAALALLAVLVGAIAACGGQGTSRAAVGAQATKPTGAGTPVSGAPQTLITNTTGHSETLITARGVTFVGSDNGYVYAFRSSNGAMLWRSAEGVLTAVDATAVYVLTGDTRNIIAALRITDGKLLWRQTLTTAQGSGAMSVVVSGGVIFASVNGSGGGGASAVYAVRASNGAQLWRWTAQVQLTEPFTITVADGLVFLQVRSNQTGNQSLDAVSASDGSLRWSYPLDAQTAIPATAGGVIYVINGQSAVDAVQDATGQRLWRFTCDADQVFQVGATLTAASGVVYAPASGRIYALRASDGARLWAATRANTTGATPDQMAVGDGGIYGKEGDGGVFALRASDGARLWSQSVNRSVMGLVEEQGRVDVASQLNVVYTLRASDGKLLWSRPVDNFASWQADSLPYFVVAGVVYVGTDHGVVQAIRASDGAILWQYAIPPTPVPAQPVYSAAITFAPSVSYQAALRAVTDLGLQVVQPCVDTSGAWQPMNAGANWPSQLLVSSTPLAPSGWLTPLGKITGVTQVQPNPAYGCPLMGGNSPAPGTLVFLAPDQAGTYARITFSAQTSYESALALVSALGFRLGDPCYEREPQGAHVSVQT